MVDQGEFGRRPVPGLLRERLGGHQPHLDEAVGTKRLIVEVTLEYIDIVTVTVKKTKLCACGTVSVRFGWLANDGKAPCVSVWCWGMGWDMM